MKRFKIARYRVNKRGKLTSSNRGYVCKVRDVELLEEMVANSGKREKLLRKRADLEETNTARTLKRLVETSDTVRDMSGLIKDMAALLKAHDKGNASRVEFLARRLFAKLPWWKRVLERIMWWKK